YFDVIPRAVDEYYSHLAAYEGQDRKAQLANPVFHIHSGAVPKVDMPVSFGLLLNLVGAAQTGDRDVLWGFISRYGKGATPESHPELDRALGYAAAYYEDFVKPNKSFRLADDNARAALQDLLARLEKLSDDADGETVQNEVYEAGKAAGYENLRDWFKALYEILLGQSQGPRMGSFFALYGLENSRDLLRKAIRGEAIA